MAGYLIPHETVEYVPNLSPGVCFTRHPWVGKVASLHPVD